MKDYRVPLIVAVGLVLFIGGYFFLGTEYADNSVIGMYISSVGQPSQSFYSCTDTDGGKDYTVKGTVTFISRSNYNGEVLETRSISDRCAHSRSLIEYYCPGPNEKYGSLRRWCVGCADGACPQQ